MKKYIAIIVFSNVGEELNSLLPSHRTYINYLINKNVIDHYAVSVESMTVWVTINAKNRYEVQEVLQKSPIFQLSDITIDELFFFDGQQYRLPALMMN